MEDVACRSKGRPSCIRSRPLLGTGPDLEKDRTRWAERIMSVVAYDFPIRLTLDLLLIVPVPSASQGLGQNAGHVSTRQEQHCADCELRL
jgi:hypothetical protein